MKDIIVSNLTPLAYAIGVWILAGACGSILGKQSNIEAWCYANPTRALIYNTLRAGGFDFKKFFSALKVWAEARAVLPPSFSTTVSVATVASGTITTETVKKVTVDIDPEQLPPGSQLKQATVATGTAVLLLGLVFASLTQGCAALIPTPTHPCDNLYCAEWRVYGTDVMVCAETPAKLEAKGRALQAAQIREEAK